MTGVSFIMKQCLSVNFTIISKRSYSHEAMPSEGIFWAFSEKDADFR